MTRDRGQPARAGVREVAHALLWTKRHRFGQLRVAEMAHLARFLREDDVCLDVGAHGGAWTVPLARRVPRGHVYAFEALPYYARVLHLMLRIARIRNATVLNYAVSDTAAPAALVWRDLRRRPLTGLTHLRGTAEESPDLVEVPGITLDGFCARLSRERIRFVKCDVEGAELRVLRGAVQMTARWRPLFYCEIRQAYCRRYGYDALDVFEHFRGRTYQPHLVGSSGLTRIRPQDYREEGDVLFVPEEMLHGA
jgi:FkbM family methyltransferase